MLNQYFTSLREKNIHLWLGGYLRHRFNRLRSPREHAPSHLLFAFCDHYEPLWGNADDRAGAARVQAWVERYPNVHKAFYDADGFHPRHSFFFPGEQYRPAFLDGLADLARQGLGEVELHLHHDGDTAQNLCESIYRYLETFAAHGHLSRDDQGRLRYGFIHGNWCLANARRDGRYCGVDEELPLLFETGCYADFTFPAAPDESQPGLVNQLYWPTGRLAARRSYENGTPCRVGEARYDRILMIQGPLAIMPKKKLPPVRIENGHMTGADPATPRRVAAWIAEKIHISGRPDWIFVKVYTHGAPEKNAQSLLDDNATVLHQTLTESYNDGAQWILHYLTAREMFNIAMAAMEGKTGNPSDYRNYLLPPPPICT